MIKQILFKFWIINKFFTRKNNAFMYRKTADRMLDSTNHLKQFIASQNFLRAGKTIVRTNFLFFVGTNCCGDENISNFLFGTISPKSDSAGNNKAWFACANGFICI